MILDLVAQVTDTPVTTIINTHSHYTQVGANPDFPSSVRIVAHATTRANIADLGVLPALVEGRGLPTQTFDDYTSLGTGADHIALYHFGRGHTAGDTWVVFPEARVLHTGDIFPGHRLPFIDVNHGGSGIEINDTLHQALAAITGVDTVIPGQGFPLTWGDFAQYVSFYDHFLQSVQSGFATDDTVDNVSNTWTMPPTHGDYPRPDLAALRRGIRVVFDELMVAEFLPATPAFSSLETLASPAPVRDDVSRPLTYDRLGATLNQIVDRFQRNSDAPAATASRAAAAYAPLYRDGSVAITVYTQADYADELADYLASREVIPRNVGQDYLEAYVPVPLLGPLSQQPGVIRVNAIIPPEPNVGQVPLSGADGHNAASWTAHGVTGQGVKVGVIDKGFYNFPELQGRELPRSVAARCYVDIGEFTANLSDCTRRSAHGTAVVEVLVDVAPDVTLYIANPRSRGDLQKTVEWMANKGVHIINHSMTWSHDGLGDGRSHASDSPLRTVDLAVSRGILWINAGGNHDRNFLVW